MTEPNGSRLTARPSAPTTGGAAPGLHKLGLTETRDAWMILPRSHQNGAPVPLAVMLHGAGGNGQRSAASLRSFAEDGNLAVLLPESRDVTWEVGRTGFGPDVAFIDAALRHVFERYTIDQSRVAIGGFSDGASYAISVGIPNGDLFTHVIAYSPGFVVDTVQAGRPRIFISHGTGDPVLPIDRCSRRIVPALRRAGYDVQYKEFSGGHTVPPEVAKEALHWFIES